jgi:cytoskeletal protein RodZ
MKRRWGIWLLLLGSPVWAEVYVWKDAQGVSHVTTEPPSRKNAAGAVRRVGRPSELPTRRSFSATPSGGRVKYSEASGDPSLVLPPPAAVSSETSASASDDGRVFEPAQEPVAMEPLITE